MSGWVEDLLGMCMNMLVYVQCRYICFMMICIMRIQQRLCCPPCTSLHRLLHLGCIEPARVMF